MDYGELLGRAFAAGAAVGAVTATTTGGVGQQAPGAPPKKQTSSRTSTPLHFEQQPQQPQQMVDFADLNLLQSSLAYDNAVAQTNTLLLSAQNVLSSSNPQQQQQAQAQAQAQVQAVAIQQQQQQQQAAAVVNNANGGVVVVPVDPTNVFSNTAPAPTAQVQATTSGSSFCVDGAGGVNNPSSRSISPPQHQLVTPQQQQHQQQHFQAPAIVPSSSVAALVPSSSATASHGEVLKSLGYTAQPSGVLPSVGNVGVGMVNQHAQAAFGVAAESCRTFVANLSDMASVASSNDCASVGGVVPQSITSSGVDIAPKQHQHQQPHPALLLNVAATNQAAIPPPITGASRPTSSSSFGGAVTGAVGGLDQHQQHAHQMVSRSTAVCTPSPPTVSASSLAKKRRRGSGGATSPHNLNASRHPPAKKLFLKTSPPIDANARAAASQQAAAMADTRHAESAALAADMLRGVTIRPSGKWQAQYYYAGKSRYIGVFDNREKAALAYEVARDRLQGKLNDIRKQDKETTDAKVVQARRAALEAVNELIRNEAASA